LCKKYSGIQADDARRLKQMKAENKKLKALLEKAQLDNDALSAALSRKHCAPE